METILTDNRSFKTADVNLDGFVPEQFSQFADEDAARVLDDGRSRRSIQIRRAGILRVVIRAIAIHAFGHAVFSPRPSRQRVA